jgi:hypothetical protein
LWHFVQRFISLRVKRVERDPEGNIFYFPFSKLDGEWKKKREKTSQGGGDNLKKFHLKNGNKKKFYLCLFSISERELEFFT